MVRQTGYSFEVVRIWQYFLDSRRFVYRILLWCCGSSVQLTHHVAELIKLYLAIAIGIELPNYLIDFLRRHVRVETQHFFDFIRR